MNKKTIHIVMTISIIFLVNTYALNVLFIDSPVSDIIDFSNFGMFYDSALVTSVNNNANITMVHNDESSGDTWETYLYNFTNLGNFSDFYANITIEFEYTGSMLMQAGVEFGSNFFANGTYGGPNKLRRMFGGGIWDAWAGLDGKYYVNAYPNDVKEQFESAHGNTTNDGIVTLHCNRTGDDVELTFMRQGYPQLSHTWSSGVSMPLNYIYLILAIDPAYCTYTSVNFTSIFVSLDDSYDPPSSTPPTSPPTSITGIFGPTGYLIGLFVIVNFIVIYVYRRRRN
jgi:hypothetical protein